MRFLPVITQIFFWAAVFSAATDNSATTSASSGHGGSTIVGYTYQDFIAYYLLTMVTRAFSSMPTLASGIAKSIRDGTIKKFLVQPVDMIGFLLIGRVAHKLVYYLVATLPFALVFYLCRGYFTNGWPPAPEMLAFFAALVMSFFLGYFLDAAIGLIGFWFLEVSSLLFVYMLLSFFLSGQMFPLDMLDKFTDRRLDHGWRFGSPDSAAIFGIFPGGDFPRQDPRRAIAVGSGGRSCLDRGADGDLPHRLQSRRAAIQRLRRINVGQAFQPDETTHNRFGGGNVAQGFHLHRIPVRLESLTYNMSLINRYLRVLDDLRPKQFDSVDDVSREFLLGKLLESVVGFLEFRLLLARVSLYAVDRQGIGLDGVSLFRLHGDRPVHLQPGGSFSDAECRGVQRIGAQRRFGFRAAQTDRYAILDLVGEIRLVGAYQFPIRGRIVELGFGSPGSSRRRSLPCCSIRSISLAAWPFYIA